MISCDKTDLAYQLNTSCTQYHKQLKQNVILIIRIHKELVRKFV